jgi:hypothetical protein
MYICCGPGAQANQRFDWQACQSIKAMPTRDGWDNQRSSPRHHALDTITESEG